MEMTITQKIDLFEQELLSLDDIKRLSEIVHSSESNLNAFSKEIQAHAGNTSAQNALPLGIGFFILGKYRQASDLLKKAKDSVQKCVYLARALCRIGNFDQAIENLQKSLACGADPLMVTLEKAALYRHAGNLDAARDQLKTCANVKNVNPDYNYQLARLHEAQGLYDNAIDNFKKALDLSPEHAKALFHLAYRCDLDGDEEAAIDYYKQLVSQSPVYISALLNLAVLYEDRAEFEKASLCVEKVLQFHPNHHKAMLFKKDIDSSKNMYYDEEKEKKRTFKHQMLETPISDFELSVRSRNCLKKMNINTIEDLLNISEAELLSYKNFGETSLKEIKQILGSKGLHLGMNLEEKQIPSVLQLGDDPGDFTADEALLSKSIDDLQFSVRAKKCIKKLNLKTIGELVHKTEAELLGCKNFGVTSLNEIKRVLADLGLSLRTLD